MKKNYLSFFTILLIAASGANLQGQDTYVTGPAKIKVNSNTLFYQGGTFNIVNSAAGATNTVINEGNIKVVGGFTNPASIANATATEFQKGNNFVNVWTDVDNYGQVIIENGAASTGYLTMQKNPIDTDAFSLGQFAIPFQYGAGYNAESAFKFLFGESIPYVGSCGLNVNCSNTRYRQSLLSWDNNEYESDAEPTGTAISSSKYYYLNFTHSGTGLTSIMNAHSNSNPLSYKGIPTPNAVTFNMSNANHPYTAASLWNESGCAGNGGDNCWSKKINNYNERYESYIDDAFIQLTNVGANQEVYGKYGFQYGNPFTSNIDLSLLSLPNLKGVYKYAEVGTTEQYGGQNTTSIQSLFVKATYNSGTWIGEPAALIVRPFEGFGIHLTNDEGGTVTIDDSYKTFSMTPSGTITPKVATPFYQLGLYLVENNDVETATANQLFIVALGDGVTGIKQLYEADYSGVVTAENGFYGLQESADETVTDFTPLYINAFNAFDYVAKPINIVFNRNSEGSYKLKGDLYEGSIFNKLAEGNYTDGSKYYFHDTVEDVLMEINSDFEYVIGNDVESTFDRYVIYWNGHPDGEMGTGDNLISSKTIVFKHGDQYKVRFSDTWKKADVTVYDILGRIVYTANSVNTASDHVLGLKQSGVYVVKSQNVNGEFELQKIIVK